jgi:Sulfatase
MPWRIALGFVLAAVAAAAIAYSRGDDGESSAAMASGKPSVVLLMFDEFPADLLLGPNGRIDRGRYPAFAELADAGYWFPNATTTFDSTTKAIPQIMDGRLPRPGGEPTFRGHPHSVYDLFDHRGYAIRRMESATSICPPRICRGARARRPAILPQLQEGRRERFGRFLASIGRTDRPTFWLGHILLPHGPYLFLPSGKQMRAGWQDLVPGINGPAGFGTQYLALHAQQRLQLQIGYVDRQLGRLFTRMRREGTFDRSLIVVTADHGISSEWGVDSRRDTTMANIDELAPVPLFVKAPGQRRGRTVRSYVRTTDVTPTIADMLGMRIGWHVDGRSAFSRAVRRRRGAMVLKRDFSRRLRISAADLSRRRAGLLRLRLQRFGSGSWDRLYTGIGPHAGLIGDRVGASSTAADGPPARIAGRSAFRSVGRSLVVPTQISGEIDSGPGRQTRDIAVAVNGTIEAVGRTFHLRPDALQSTHEGESFSVMVPERSMRRGRNSVEILAIESGGRRLVRLGHS